MALEYHGVVGRLRLAFITLCILHTANETKGAPEQRQVPNLSKHPILLVVSFDGFRWDYMSKTETPYLTALMKEGVTVPYMQAQFPTKTFPNHQSMATGLYPDIHGITDNTLWDPLLGKRLSGFTDDPEFWNYNEDVIPFWIRNEQAGDERYSGAFLWAGSSQGYGVNGSLFPTYYIPQYDESILWETRVETVIAWMTHEIKPANMVFLYHNEPDSHGHSFGTDDAHTLEEVRKADARAGQLVDALKKANIFDRVNIIILSDHGMQSVNQINIINTTGMANSNLYINQGGTPVYHIMPHNANDLDTIYDSFKARAVGQNFSVYKKEELLEMFNYGSNRRIMDILLLAEPGFGFEDMSRFSDAGFAGVHGYDNTHPSMRALFIASGPVFKNRYDASQPINNLDLVPLFSEIMGVPEPPNNGTLDNIMEILETATTPPPSSAVQNNISAILLYIMCIALLY